MKLNAKLATLALTIGLACLAQAADRTEITFTDGRIFPESLTSTKNGAVYFGSLGQDSVYRAAPNAAKAETWIRPKTNGLQTVLGVFADEPAGTLWVCASASGGRNGAPLVGETALKAFSLKDAAFKASYAFPAGGRTHAANQRPQLEAPSEHSSANLDDPSAHAPWTSTMSGRSLIRRSLSGLAYAEPRTLADRSPHRTRESPGPTPGGPCFTRLRCAGAA